MWRKGPYVNPALVDQQVCEWHEIPPSCPAYDGFVMFELQHRLQLFMPVGAQG